MIWIFETKNKECLLVSAKSEADALNIIKDRMWESVHGELHTELKFIIGADALVINEQIDKIKRI